LTVVELAEELAVDKSVASRLLASLLTQSYVVRDPDNERYELSLRLLHLTTRFADRIGFPAFCQPALDELSSTVRELVQLSVADGRRLVLTAHSQFHHGGLEVIPRPGTNVSPHATASGRVWLAGFDDDVALEIALHHGLRPITPRTVATRDGLLAKLARVRANGFAVVVGEFIEAVNAVAVPIGYDRFARVVGTIAVSAPAHRLDADDVMDVTEQLKDVATDLERVWPTHAASLARCHASLEPPAADCNGLYSSDIVRVDARGSDHPHPAYCAGTTGVIQEGALHARRCDAVLPGLSGLGSLRGA
jgi:DNA-binding IclR family transcriptional regulator